MDMNIPLPVVNVTTALYDQVPPLQRVRGNEPMTEYLFSDQLSAFLDRRLSAMWLRWNPAPRPNFNPGLLQDLSRYCQFLTRSETRFEQEEGISHINYAILASGVKGVFNLGGDLNLFGELIEAQNHDGLLKYGRACIDVLYRNYIAHGLPITTISLIQGECLGGGFEAALSSDVLIAERSARFGFPEILFNLFPGMGAYSFLERRIGRQKAEELIGSGKIYSADDMLGLGIVDVVAEDGKGEEEVAAFINARTRSRNGHVGLAAARRCVHRLDFQELSDVVDAWVDTALRLSTRDLKLMKRLVSRQNHPLANRDLH